MQRSNLLQAKLIRPRLNDNLISRPGLFERLERGKKRKLTLICAPAGYGKSTTVAGWLGACPRPAAWLSLDEMDGDLIGVLTYVVAAIQTIFPDGCARTLRLLEAPQPPPAEYLTTTFSNDIIALNEAFILVLDDYHAINQQAVHPFFSRLIAHMPGQMQLVIVSRETPPLSIPRLRGRREIMEIRTRDLQFSPAEAGAFLGRFLKAPLPDDVVHVLVERTEGWVAGLQLAAVSMRHQSDYTAFLEKFRGTNRYIMGYLLDEVLMRQPKPVRDFLLKTAILNRFCGSLCDAVTQNDDPDRNGQSYLEWLRQTNFFVVPLDQEGRWYRYHHLFQDLLRYKLMAEESNQAVAALHVLAGEWLANHGLVDEAIPHLLAAGEHEAAARIIERSWRQALDQDDWRKVEQWLALLPAELIQERPGLLIARAQVLLFLVNLRPIPALLQAAATCLQEPAVPLRPNEASLLGADIDFLQGALACLSGQGQPAFDHLQRALSQTHPDYRHWRGQVILYFSLSAQMIGRQELAIQTIEQELQDETAPENMLTVRLLGAQGLVYLMAGKLSKFIQIVAYGSKICERHNYVNMLASGHYLLGHANYLWNNLDVAASHLAQAVELRYNLNTRAGVDALAASVLTAHAMDQSAQANDALKLLLDFALQRQSPAIVAIAHACQARLALQQGDLEAATRWLETADLAYDSGAMFHWLELPRLTYCRVLIAHGTVAALQEAVEKLQVFLKSAEASHNIRQTIEILILQSLAFQAQERADDALAALEKAVILARPGGFIRSFVDYGLPMAALLHQLANRDIALTYVRQILAAITGGQFPANNLRLEENKSGNRQSEIVNPLVEPLTDREFEILELLARRLSNQEIARSLHISIRTVKSHATHIYGKLNVNSRYEAVAKAKALELLPADTD
ncbi:MAG: hypothetical protein KDJ65_08675 [Anaerolineae bacterium]|nr:hypothetical protein [Anaerolineae bacterium]